MSDSAALGPLPEWDLSDLYVSPEAPALADDLARLKRQAPEFKQRYQGRLGELDGDALGAAVESYEAAEELIGRISAYTNLCYAADMGNEEVGRFYATTRERLNDISAELLFFELELNRLEEEALEAKLAVPRLARYRPWLSALRAMRPYQLSDDLEQLLHDKQIAGRAAWNRLFDETLAALRFEVDGAQLTAEQTLHLLSDKDAATRRRAAEALSKTFQQNLRLFAHITNTLAKDKEIEDKWRALPAPDTARHLANQVEAEVVEALRHSVVEAYPRLSHRYYRLKAKWMGVKQLDYWDRNAPLPEDADRQIPWAQAQTLVLDAYGRFSPELAAIGRRFFEIRWIDAPARPGKSPGAFAHPTVPSVHPYLLLNYQGKARDVMTLAHELGHGVHQVLAGAQGALLSETPLTLAETASVFGEMLTFRALLAGEAAPQMRKLLIASKVEDMINTVVRQIAFYEFERRMHAERRDGELSAERIGRIWLDVQSESLGPTVRLNPDYATFWCYIPHFIHSPFYVYAYAFGDCLVNSLYAVYEQAADGFQEKYLDMLKAGGAKRHKELLAPFGLDASDPAFWRQGLNVIEALIDELETF